MMQFLPSESDGLLQLSIDDGIIYLRTATRCQLQQVFILANAVRIADGLDALITNMDYED